MAMSQTSSVKLSDPNRPTTCCALKTTADDDFEQGHSDAAYMDFRGGDGALPNGGALRLLSRQSLGLFAQYAGIGFIVTALPCVAMNNELAASQFDTFNSYLAIPSYLSVVFGMFPDWFPILGYHRVPYLLLGWFICSTMLVIQWFWPRKPIDNSGVSDMRYDTAMLPMVFCVVGYWMVQVTADAMMVEMTQREPLAMRGRTTSVAVVVRMAFQILAVVFMISLDIIHGELNDGERMSTDVKMVCLLLATAVAFVMALVVVHEDNNLGRTSKEARGQVLSHQFSELWKWLQQRVVLQVIVYLFVNAVPGKVRYQYTKDEWAFHAEIWTLVGKLVFCLVAIVLLKCGLVNWNWRTILVATQMLMMVFNGCSNLLYVWGMVEHESLNALASIAVEASTWLQYLVAAYLVIELAPRGTQAIVFGLMTSIFAVGECIAGIISKWFTTASSRTPRSDSWCILVAVSFQMVPLVFLLRLTRKHCFTIRLHTNPLHGSWLRVYWSLSPGCCPPWANTPPRRNRKSDSKRLARGKMSYL